MMPKRCTVRLFGLTPTTCRRSITRRSSSVSMAIWMKRRNWPKRPWKKRPANRGFPIPWPTYTSKRASVTLPSARLAIWCGDIPIFQFSTTIWGWRCMKRAIEQRPRRNCRRLWPVTPGYPSNPASRSCWAASASLDFGRRHFRLKGLDQIVELNGLRNKRVHAGLETAFTRALHDIRCHGDDGRMRILSFAASDLGGRFVAVHLGHLTVHEDHAVLG